MHAPPPPLVIQTSDEPRFAVLWLHGLGADGNDFVPIVPELGLDLPFGGRFIFPNAPSIPVTCNGGYVMPAWYDIISLDSASRVVDETGLLASRQTVRELITQENRRGIPCSRIFLAGFSQGGAVAYTSAMTHPEPLAGVIALSTYIPSESLLDNHACTANREIPIFAGHGRYDDVVSISLGQRARDYLAARAGKISWHDYPMDHSVCLEEIRDIGNWLQQRLDALFDQQDPQST